MTEPRLTPEMITMYGTGWCPDCRRSKRWLEENKVAFVYVDIDADADGAEFVKSVNNGNRSVPTIVFPDGTKLVEPSNIELAEKVG